MPPEAPPGASSVAYTRAMPLDVIGAGFGRTGTLSLKLALERLGFTRCYHMLELREHPEHLPHWERAHAGAPVDWEALFSGYRAAVDWPACSYWKDYCALYTRAKVILTVRDPDAWYESVQSTIYPSSVGGRGSDNPDDRARADLQRRQIWEQTFGGRFEDRDHAIEVFRAHNRAVERTVPAERLLVIEPGAGWEPLCRFLEVDVPAEPYPRSNARADFDALWKR